MELLVINRCLLSHTYTLDYIPQNTKRVILCYTLFARILGADINLWVCVQLTHWRYVFGRYETSGFLRISVPSNVHAYRDHLPFRWHECWPVAESQFSLKGVEVDLQLTLLLDFRGFMLTPIISEILQLLLHGLHGVFRSAVLQPWDCSPDPF